MRAAVSLLFLLPMVAGVNIGSEQLLYHGVMDPGTPAAGNGFAAWIDFTRGEQVKMHYEDEVYTLASGEQEGDAHSSVDAHGNWLVWELNRIPSRLPGESVGAFNADLVVYDLARGQVHDSGTPTINETRPRVGGDRAVFLSDDSGIFQVHQMPLKGSNAFRSEPVDPTGRLQVQPDVSKNWIVYLERTNEGDGIRLVGSDVSWFREPARMGYKDPVVHGDVIAWTSYEEGQSWLHWENLATGDSDSFVGTGIFGRPSLNDEMIAVHQSGDMKQVYVACFGDELEPVSSVGERFSPSLGRDALYSIQVTQAGSDLVSRSVSCGEIVEKQESPAPFILGLIVLGTIAHLWRYAGRSRR